MNLLTKFGYNRYINMDCAFSFANYVLDLFIKISNGDVHRDVIPYCSPYQGSSGIFLMC